MLKEEKNLREKWNELRKTVETNKSTISSTDLYKLCQDWAHYIKVSTIDWVADLYNVHFTYFEKFNIEDYNFPEKWYLLEDIIEYDILKPDFTNINHAVARCSEVMWHLLIFRSNVDCKTCNDNLRAFIDDRENVYLRCDRCNHTQTLDNRPLIVDGLLSPITPAIQWEKLIVPSLP